VDVVTDLPTDPQAAEPVQVGERTLDNPALSAQSRAVFGASAGDQGFHSQTPDQAPVLVVVVPAVSEDDIGAPPWTATLAPHGRHRFKERNELGDVVAVSAGQDDGERDAGGVGDQVVFAARPAPVNWASSRLGAPFNARM
jgi:hypothetical protein